MNWKTGSVRSLTPALLLLLCTFVSCGDQPSDTDEDLPIRPPECSKPAHTRADLQTPVSVAPDWGPPLRLGSPVNTPCPEDAIALSPDGLVLYFLFTADLLENQDPAQIFSLPNGTYAATRSGGPGDFGTPTFVDLGLGIDASLDGAPSFAPDGRSVYFHSIRATNTGYLQNPPVDDILDIYEADLVDGKAGPGRNLGGTVNSIYWDGEPAIHPDGRNLYFTSTRPGGEGGDDLWIATQSGTTWSSPANLGPPINSAAKETQPAFTADGDTLYFVSDRDPRVGGAIYRSARIPEGWGEPDLVVQGLVGEPAITPDGRYLYFVHVLADTAGLFDADIWYCERRPVGR